MRSWLENESVCMACVPFEIVSVPNAWILVFGCSRGDILSAKATRERGEHEQEGDRPYVCTPPHRAAEEEERFKLM